MELNVAVIDGINHVWAIFPSDIWQLYDTVDELVEFDIFIQDLAI